MRRILLLITDLEIGGTPTVVRELAVRLQSRRDVKVEVVCLSGWGPVASQLRDAGVHVTALGAHSAFELPYVVWKLVRLVRRGRFDTVVSFLIHANLVSALAGGFCRQTRFIQSIQTTQPHPRWHWWLQRLLHHAADRVVVPSPSAAEVAHDWSDVPHDKIVIIPNAVDLHAFRAAGGASAAGRDAFNIGFIGRLDPVKRVPDLLRALSSLEERFHLHIYGDGPERQRIQRLMDWLGVTHRVTLHGFIVRPQAALEQLDLLVLPSEAEGFGLVLIEAMAAHVPVVGSDVAGIRDVVRRDQTGILVPVASPGDIAAAVRMIAKDPQLRETLIRNAYNDVKLRFTWEAALPQYLRLLELG